MNFANFIRQLFSRGQLNKEDIVSIKLEKISIEYHQYIKAYCEGWLRGDSWGRLVPLLSKRANTLINLKKILGRESRLCTSEDFTKVTKYLVPSLIRDIELNDKIAIGVSPYYYERTQKAATDISFIAAEVLKCISGKDFGQDSKKWQTWWDDLHKTVYDHEVVGHENIMQGALSEIKGTMKKHITDMVKKFSGNRALEFTKLHWEKLLKDEILTFSAESALKTIERTLQDSKHYYTTKKFDDVYVAVSIFPTIDEKKCREILQDEGGYNTLMDTLLNKSNYLNNVCDFAHWVYCYEGKDKHKVHLTFIPSKGLPPSETLIVFAQDLMTQGEKQMVGL